MRNDGGPAFGGAYDQVFGEDGGKGPLHKIEARVAGMSLRDYFAAAALPKCQSVVFEVGPKEGKSTTARIASICYEQADALLAEREKS